MKKFKVTFYSLWTEEEFVQYHEANSKEELESRLDDMDFDCVMAIDIVEITIA